MIRYSFDNKRLISCGEDKLIAIYNTETGYQEAKYRGVSDKNEPDGADTPIQDLIFTRDNRRILSTYNKNIKIWNVESYFADKTIESHKETVR